MFDNDSAGEMDAQTLTFNRKWGLGGCLQPVGTALDTRNHRLFLSCLDNQLAVIDVSSGRRIASLPIGSHSYELAYDSTTGMVFNPNGSGTMTVIHEDSPTHYSLEGEAQSAEGEPVAVADAVTHRIFVLRRSGIGHHVTLVVMQSR
jgi:DNA-binding beta-propeller fold protein YncE